MPDDRVRIVPQFRTSGTKGGDVEGCSPRRALVAMVVLVIAVAVLLGSPQSATSERNEGLAVEIAAITEALSTAGPMTGEASETRSTMPLADAVPGFVDTITVVTRSEHGGDVLRWPASESAPATLLSVEDDGGRSGSVDASGRWFMELREPASLVVYAVNDGNPRSPEPRIVSGAVGGVEAWSAAWHDSDAGRLAWLECSGDGPRPVVAMSTAELAGWRNGAAAQSVPLPDLPCDDRRVQVVRWGDWGWLLNVADASGGAQSLLLDGAGRVATPSDRARFVGVGPAQTTVWSEIGGERRADAFLVSADGAATPVPGLASGERLEGALASPDDRLSALVIDLFGSSGSTVRIVDNGTGEVVAEVAESGPWAGSMVWSSDSRFLVFERWPAVPTSRRGVPQPVELVFYDTGAHTSATLPLEGPALSLSSAG